MATGQPYPQIQVLERGNILFLYQPKSTVAHAQGADDLQAIYFMLLPDEREQHKSRIFAVPRGLFPVLVPGSAAPEERAWAFAQEVHPDPRVALDSLQEEAMAALAPGQRARPWVRAAGEGRYTIVKHGADTHLAYVLDKPEQPGEVQQALKIAPRGNYLISVLAPAAPAEIKVDRRPTYPPRLQSRFRDDRAPVEPSDFLDYPYTRVFLLAAGLDAEQELGVKLEPNIQNWAQRKALQMLHKEETKAASEGISLLEPLMEGRWA